MELFTGLVIRLGKCMSGNKTCEGESVLDYCAGCRHFSARFASGGNPRFFSSVR